MIAVQKKILEITDKIASEFHPEKIVLFGSYAWGEPGPDSDVDLFIVKETDDTREADRNISRFLFPRPFPIDLIVSTPAQLEKRKKLKDFFIQEILSRGKILYAK